MSNDLDAFYSGFYNNFAYGTFSLDSSSYVKLVDNSDNASGAGPETVYTDSLAVPADATLDLSGYHLYTRNSSIAGTVLHGTITVLPPLASLNTTTTVHVNAASATYGDTLNFTANVTAEDPVAGTPFGTIQFMVGGTTLGLPVALVNGMATSPSIATLGAGSHTVSASYNSVYLLNNSSSGNVSFSIAKASLTIKADDASKVYGQANPTFSATYTGFVNGDNAASLTTLPSFSTVATAASAVGNYAITPGNAASNNYTFVYQNGTLSVTKAALTIKADDASKVYGQANPSFSATYSGFVNGDTAANLTTLPTLNTTATTSSGAGFYAINASGAATDSYNITYQSGSLEIAKAHLTVAADNKAMVHGDAVPALTYSLAGFVNGDTASVVSGSPLLSTAATSASSAGFYAISVAPGSLTASDYEFDLVAGTLTVQPKVVDVRVSWGSRSMSILGLTRNLPFTNIKAIDVIFSDDVSVDAADLALKSSLTAGKSYATNGFSYYAATHAARWTLPNALEADKLQLSLDGDAVGNDGIHAAGGIYLGAYSAGFLVLPGDFNGDNAVNSQDMVGVRNGMLGTLDLALTLWADLDGDGDIDLSDYTVSKKNVGKRL